MTLDMGSVRDFVVTVLLFLGAGLLLLAGVGVLRMPDLFTRMQTATKASTLGVVLMLAAVAVHFGEVPVTARAVAIIAFFFLTAPVTAHVIARAAYFVGTPLWDRTVIDELRAHRERA